MVCHPSRRRGAREPPRSPTSSGRRWLGVGGGALTPGNGDLRNGDPGAYFRRRTIPDPGTRPRGGPMRFSRRLLPVLLLLSAVPASAHDYEVDCTPMSPEARAEFENARMMAKLDCAGLHAY